MPGRKFSAGNVYRYGFNGKENDNEVKGEGNQQDYGMRIYDPRLGRFLSVDPFTSKYPELTPYQFASNRPIDGIDLDGLEWQKGEPYFLAPIGKFVTDYKVVLNVTAKSFLNVNTNKNDLVQIGEIASGILSKPNAVGTKNDPIINVSIIWADNNEGSFKFSAVSAAIRQDNKKGQEPSYTTTLSDGTLYEEKISARGITETLGDVTNNHVKVVLFTDFTMYEDGKRISKPVIISNSFSVESRGRSLAHELGHTLGLHHPWDTKDDGADDKDINNTMGLGPVFKPQVVLNNLMNSEGNKVKSLNSSKGTQLTDKQRNKIDQKLDEVKKTP